LVTYNVAASEGKKTEEGMTTPTLELLSNSIAVTNLPEAQPLTPARSEEASDILTSCKI
jgi:hypothetical protein